MKIVNFLLIMLISIFLLDCSGEKPDSPFPTGYFDDDDGNKSTKQLDYFPMHQGSYWIYNRYGLDEDNQRDYQRNSMDSVVIIGEIVKNGKDARIFQTFNKQTNSYNLASEQFYVSEDSKLLTLQSYLQIFLDGMPLEFMELSDEDWITIVDPNDDLWRIYRQKFDDESLSGLPFATINGKVDILASWEGTQEILIGNKTVIAEEYLLTFDFNVIIEIPFIGSQNITIYRELYQYYAKDIGLVKSKLNTSSLSLPLLGGIVLPGSEIQLIKYHISN